MCTDNPVIVKNTTNAPTIICLQRKAEKKVPTEADIISANKLAFNDEIGIVTNHITSVDSAEYKELAYRIMCGQLFQQNTIDRAKGIIADLKRRGYNPAKDRFIFLAGQQYIRELTRPGMLENYSSVFKSNDLSGIGHILHFFKSKGF